MWEWLQTADNQVSGWWYVYGGLVLRAAVAVACGFLLHTVIMFIAGRIAKRSRWEIDEKILKAICRPTRRLAIVLSLLTIPIYPSELSEKNATTLRHIVSLLVVYYSVHLLLRLTRVVDQVVKEQHPLDTPDNYMARRVHTQTTVLRRTANLFIVFVGVAIAVMTFPRVRQLGTGLLASAGIAGAIVGLALRPLLENLLAGLQIALTQPIKIEDWVMIEGELGRIEEINSTYVVVHVWDERRIIVPLSKFIQEPFQNWTRRTTRLLGTVYLYADYKLPIQAVREEFFRIVHSATHWDGRVASLQVTDATEHSMQLRCLVSAESSSKSWDLRTEIREKLIEFMQREFPECLPHARVTLLAADGRDVFPRPQSSSNSSGIEEPASK